MLLQFLLLLLLVMLLMLLILYILLILPLLKLLLLLLLMRQCLILLPLATPRQALPPPSPFFPHPFLPFPRCWGHPPGDRPEAVQCRLQARDLPHDS